MKRYHLTVVRHGETFENRLGIIQGQMDVHLSPRGLEQAARLGASLVKEGRQFTHIFSSDLLRARQTAETALNTNGGENLWRGVEVSHDCRLRERCYGSGEGKSRSELARDAKAMGLRPEEYLPPGAETDKQLLRRAESFFTEINSLVSDLLFPGRSECLRAEENAGCADRDCGECSYSKGRPPHVLVFSHGGWILNLLLYFKFNLPFTNKAQQKGPLIRTPPNTGLCEFVVDLKADRQEPIQITCYRAHDTTHLMADED